MLMGLYDVSLPHVYDIHSYSGHVSDAMSTTTSEALRGSSYDPSPSLTIRVEEEEGRGENIF